MPVDRQLRAAIDLNILQYAFILLRQLAQQRFRGLVKVVVTIEHGIGNG